MTHARTNAAFELEGMVSTITVLRLLTEDLDALARGLREHIAQMPGFFQDAPVALDLSALEGADDDEDGAGPDVPREVPLPELCAVLRDLRLVPVGVRRLRESRRAAAREAGLSLLRGAGRKAPRPREPETEGGAASTDSERSPDERRSGADRRQDGLLAVPSLVLRAPLRSGQVVYAEQCDAIALANVNAGAELIADGNIHVYGTLRGRALAGAHGNEEARIFVRSLEADLVAIAGCYLRADEIPEARRGKPAQIFLEGEKLQIAEL